MLEFLLWLWLRQSLFANTAFNVIDITFLRSFYQPNQNYPNFSAYMAELQIPNRQKCSQCKTINIHHTKISLQKQQHYNMINCHWIGLRRHPAASPVPLGAAARRQWVHGSPAAPSGAPWTGGPKMAYAHPLSSNHIRLDVFRCLSPGLDPMRWGPFLAG